MEKPMSMPLKEHLIKKLSLKLNISEKIIGTVITDQFTEAFRATSTHNSIELSGFGKFVFNQKKAHQQMVKYQEQKAVYENALLVLPDEEKKNTVLRLNTVLKNIEHLKPKLK